MDLYLSDEEVDKILKVYWKQIVYFAYDQYKNLGRGIVIIWKAEDENDPLKSDVRLLYLGSGCVPGQPMDPKMAKFVAEYDPKWEMVIQYLRPDQSVRTMRIGTAPGKQHPWRVWLFANLEKLEANKSSEQDQSLVTAH